MDTDRAALEVRMRTYFDDSVSWNRLLELTSGLTMSAGGFDPQKARNNALQKEHFDTRNLRRYALRPFEVVNCYYSGASTLWNRPRPALNKLAWDGQRFLMSRPAGVVDQEGPPMSYARCIGDNDYLRGHAYFIPFESLPHGTKSTNLAHSTRQYQDSIGHQDGDDLWYHVLAVGFSPAYLTENADGIRQDWPRVPLPSTRLLLDASGALGTRIAALIDTESPFPVGEVGSDLLVFGNVTSATDSGKPLQPGKGQLALSAGWGHYGQRNAVMPGRGRFTEREWSPSERKAITDGAMARGLDDSAAYANLGDTCLDIHLNEHAFWRAVPKLAWEYRIGGYQVIKKWLSYRERTILGRDLTMEEVRYVTEIIRRLSAILLLQPLLDANYRSVVANTYPWPNKSD